jgi:endonuclease YncB( thermonuclease family)
MTPACRQAMPATGGCSPAAVRPQSDRSLSVMSAGAAGGCVRRYGFAALLGFAALVPLAAFGQTGTDPRCQYEPLGTGRVAQVSDGRTLLLADGREVRLAGIEVPASDSTVGRAARATLAEWTLDQAVILRQAGPERDRYARITAHVFTEGAGTGRSLQQRLLAAGYARLSMRAGERACAAESLQFEHRAREAKLGLWADPYYQLQRAEHAAEVLAHRGRFAIVEGTVLSVRESGGTIYVNFGRRWSEDFTATIPKRSERAFAAAGIEPKQLERRRIRVRGWIEERGGPWVEVTRPEQVEIVERTR